MPYKQLRRLGRSSFQCPQLSVAQVLLTVEERWGECDGGREESQFELIVTLGNPLTCEISWNPYSRAVTVMKTFGIVMKMKRFPEEMAWKKMVSE